MKLFNFLKRPTPTKQPTFNYQKELAKIIALYETYPVFPFIAYEEDGIEEWIEEISQKPELLISKENMTPNEDNLLPGDLLLLKWLHGCSSTVSEFPVIFRRTYGIDPDIKLEQYLFNDYLDVDVDISSLTFSSLEELNSILTEHSLPKQGTITEAISLISQEFSESFLADLTYPGVYVLMPKGQLMIEKYL